MSINPFLKSWRTINYYITFWLIAAILYSIVIYFGNPVSVKYILIESFITHIIISLLGLSYWYSARFLPFNADKAVRIIAIHTIAGIAASALVLFVSKGLIDYFISDYSYHRFWETTISWRIMYGLLYYYVLISIYYTILYYIDLQEKSNKEAELNNLVTQAEIKTLKFQINPHFIFNSLNSVSALTTIDAMKAKEMVIKLAEFLRYTLSTNDKQTNKLSEELKNIKLYLDIEKIRFEEKFEFVDEIDECCHNVVVPNMILQPLFENAIKHAVYDTFDTVYLRLKCNSEKQFMRISLENNFEQSIKNKKGAGVGLKNIEKRLELFYGLKNLMNVEKTETHFKVSLLIPQ